MGYIASSIAFLWSNFARKIIVVLRWLRRDQKSCLRSIQLIKINVARLTPFWKQLLLDNRNLHINLHFLVKDTVKAQKGSMLWHYIFDELYSYIDKLIWIRWVLAFTLLSENLLGLPDCKQHVSPSPQIGKSSHSSRLNNSFFIFCQGSVERWYSQIPSYGIACNEISFAIQQNISSLLCLGSVMTLADWSRRKEGKVLFVEFHVCFEKIWCMN